MSMINYVSRIIWHISVTFECSSVNEFMCSLDNEAVTVTVTYVPVDFIDIQ